MRARRRHLIDQVVEQHARLVGDEVARKEFKRHLEQFSDDEIERELVELKARQP